MSKNRIIYRSEAIFSSKEVGSSGFLDHNELSRIQGANYSFSVETKSVTQYGKSKRVDSFVLEQPTVNFDFSYSSLSSQLSLSRLSLAAAAFLLSPLLPILSQTRPTKQLSSLTHVLLDSSAAASRRSSL